MRGFDVTQGRTKVQDHEDDGEGERGHPGKGFEVAPGETKVGWNRSSRSRGGKVNGRGHRGRISMCHLAEPKLAGTKVQSHGGIRGRERRGYRGKWGTE